MLSVLSESVMPSRVSRSSAAHVFQSVNKDHSVNDDEVRLLDPDEFVFFMKKLLQQIAMAERGCIEQHLSSRL